MSDPARLGDAGIQEQMNARGTQTAPAINPVDVVANFGRVHWRPPEWMARQLAQKANTPPADLVERLAMARDLLVARTAVSTATRAWIAASAHSTPGGAAGDGLAPHQIEAAQDMAAAMKLEQNARGALSIALGIDKAAIDKVVEDDIAALATYLLDEVNLVNADIAAQRRNLLASIRARYQEPTEQQGLALATAARVAMQGGVPFSIGTRPGKCDARTGIPTETRYAVSRNAGELPAKPYWYVPPQADPDLTSFLGISPSPDDASRVIVQMHPLCLVMHKVFWPQELRDLLYRSTGEDTQSVGVRIADETLRRLETRLAEAQPDLSDLTTNSATFHAVAPLFDIACDHILRRTRQPGLDEALKAAAVSLAPSGFSTQELITTIGGFVLLAFALGTGNFVLAGWLVVGVALVDAALSLAELGLAYDDLLKAQELVEAEDADGLFELLDPALNAVENAPSIPLAWAGFMVGMLSMVPVAGDLIGGLRNAGRAAANRARQAALRRGIGTEAHVRNTPGVGDMSLAPATGGELSETVGGDVQGALSAATRTNAPARTFPTPGARVTDTGTLTGRVLAEAGVEATDTTADAIGAAITRFIDDAPRNLTDLDTVAEFLEETRRLSYKGRSAGNLPNAVAEPLHRASLSAAYGEDFATRALRLEAEDTFQALPSTSLYDDRPLRTVVDEFHNSYRLGDGLADAVEQADALRAAPHIRAIAEEAVNAGTGLSPRHTPYTFRSSSHNLGLPSLHQIDIETEIFRVAKEGSPLNGAYVYKIVFDRAQFAHAALREWPDLIQDRFDLSNAFIAREFAEAGSLPKVRLRSEMGEAKRTSARFRKDLYDAQTAGGTRLHTAANLNVDEATALALGGIATDEVQIAIESTLNGMLAKADTHILSFARGQPNDPVHIAQFIIEFR